MYSIGPRNIISFRFWNVARNHGREQYENRRKSHLCLSYSFESNQQDFFPVPCECTLFKSLKGNYISSEDFIVICVLVRCTRFCLFAEDLVSTPIRLWDNVVTVENMGEVDSELPSLFPLYYWQSVLSSSKRLYFYIPTIISVCSFRRIETKRASELRVENQGENCSDARPQDLHFLKTKN